MPFPPVILAVQLLAAGSLLVAGSLPVPTTAFSPMSARPTSVPATGESCYAGKDLVVQALERLRPDTSRAQLTDANELLKRAIDLCSESGEAWYYRALVETEMKDPSHAAYALRQAERFGSDALQQKVNPFVLSTPKSGEASPGSAVHQRWALVIGIGAFADKAVKPLAYTTGDAQSFRDLLVDPKGPAFPAGNVRLLADSSATLRGIKEALNWLARSAGPDDLVVVYIASHGSARDADTAGANYILAHDTEIGADVNPDLLYATALPMVELANDIATRFQSRRTAVFLDTCYSGGAFSPGDRQLAPGVATAAVSQATLDRFSQGTGRIIFAASRTDQQSLESEALHHGYFTWFLTQALHKNPGAPLTQVFSAVQQRVSKQVATDYALYGLHQDPVIHRSSDTTDFSLGSVPSTATTAMMEVR